MRKKFALLLFVILLEIEAMLFIPMLQLYNWSFFATMLIVGICILGLQLNYYICKIQLLSPKNKRRKYYKKEIFSNVYVIVLSTLAYLGECMQNTIFFIVLPIMILLYLVVYFKGEISETTK